MRDACAVLPLAEVPGADHTGIAFFDRAIIARSGNQDNSAISASGWMRQPASPATPISTPKPIGTSAAR